MNIKPIRDMVLVLRNDKKTQTEGGIILPDYAQDPENFGVVKAVGPKVTEVKPGDKVRFIWAAGYDIKSEGVEYNTLLLMKESDIQCAIDDEPEFKPLAIARTIDLTESDRNISVESFEKLLEFVEETTKKKIDWNFEKGQMVVSISEQV